MTITLYKCKCEPMYLNKTSYLVDSLTLSDAEFRTDKEIDLEYPYLIIGIFTNYLLYNYCYINDLGKYYYIYNRKVLDGSRLLLELHEDHLFTFKSKILDTSTYAFVKRSSSDYDLQIMDDKASPRENQQIFYTMKSTDSPTNMINRCIDWNTSDAYVMVVYMNEEPVTPIAPIPSGYSPIIKNTRYKNAGYGCCTYYRLFTFANFKLFAKEVYASVTLRSYIKACYIFPFAVEINDSTISTFNGKFPIKSAVATLQVGNTTINVSNHEPRIYLDKFPIYNYDASPEINQRWNYTNPHSKYSVWIDYYGWFEIEFKYFARGEILIYYALDWETGDTTLVCEYYDDTEKINTVIRTESCRVCTPISLSNTNTEQIKNQRNANFQATTISTIAGALSLAGGITTKNPYLLASGVASLGGGIVSGINKNAQLYEVGNNTPSSYSVSVSLPYYTAYVLYKREYIDYVFPNASFLGYPTNQYKQLSALTGYVEAVDLRIADTSGITKHELEEIKKMLANGIII